MSIAVVSAEGLEAAKAGAERFRLPFPVLVDPGGVLMDRTGLRHAGGGSEGDVYFASLYLVDGGGIVRWAHVPTDLRARAHPDEILAAARSLAP